MIRRYPIFQRHIAEHPRLQLLIVSSHPCFLPHLEGAAAVVFQQPPIGPLKKVKLRGLAKVDWLFVFSCAAFNLIRIPKLRAQNA
jgi:hypothetical protein